MDRASIVTLLVNALATIATTWVVARISLGKPVFSLHPSARSLFQKHWFTLFALAMIALNAYYVIKFLAVSGPPNRLEVIIVPINVLNVFAYIFFLAVEITRSRKKV